jgi:hypothetical protein
MPEAKRHESPEGKVLCSIEASSVEALVAALTAAGFDKDQIDILSAEDIEEMDAPLERPGLRGLMGRVLLSMGDDLDALEQAKQEIADGYTLLGVQVERDDAVHRAAAVMREHGARTITHFGRWTISDLP